MHIFNYLHLKRSINTDDLKLNTYDTIINYFFTSAPMQNFSQIMSFSSFGFSTILSHAGHGMERNGGWFFRIPYSQFSSIPY